MFGFLKNELLEVIEWREQSNDLLLWKFPDKDCNIKYGAQLIVRESQMALFLNEGQVADTYTAGRYELETQNMPILSRLKAWKHGFNSPFKADVYYISSRQLTQFRWGTANPIYVDDPQAGRIPIRARGAYFVKVKDAAKFFREYAGSKSQMYVSELEDVLRPLVLPTFTEVLKESKIPAWEIQSNFSELAQAIAPRLQETLDNFGLELTKFQIEDMSFPPEIEAHLQKLSKARLTTNEDLGKMQQMAQMNAMETSAEKGQFENWQGTQNNMMMQQMMMQQMMQQNQMNQQNNPPPQQQQQQPQGEKEMSREDVMKMLKELGELKAMGVLTEEEFNAKKTELLAKL